MGSSHSARTAALAVVFSLLAGCNPGGGSGTVTGVVSAPSCGLDPSEPFDLDPTDFYIDPTETFVEIMLQHGGDYEDRSNVVSIFVADPVGVKTSRLGQPISVDMSATDGVSMALALNETCPFSRDRDVDPVAYVAVSGTITFSSLYFPEFDDSRDTAAVFTDVRFEDSSNPTERFAVLSGEFQFSYSRRAQRTP